MASGTVKKINEKGFGFIDSGQGKDVFFHATGMAEKGAFDNLQVGDRVSYEIDNSGDRPRAINVREGG